jgi:hypothetical protein
MSKHAVTAAILSALVAAACGSEPAPGETADAVAARPAGDAASGVCGLFTREEVGSLLALPVEPGEVAGPQGTACQWDARSDDASYAQVQVVSGADYWSRPTGAAGYEAVEGIGSEAYVHPELGGWTAGALTDTAVAAVSVVGGAASRETAVRLLRMLVERM